MNEKLEINHDPIEDKLDELAGLFALWQKHREAKRTPNSVRAGVLLGIDEIQMIKKAAMPNNTNIFTQSMFHLFQDSSQREYVLSLQNAARHMADALENHQSFYKRDNALDLYNKTKGHYKLTADIQRLADTLKVSIEDLTADFDDRYFKAHKKHD